MSRRIQISRKASLLFVACIGWISWTHHLDAHVFGGVFDERNPIAVTGSIVKVDLVYPDSFIHVRVEDGRGGFQVWAFMTLPPNPLRRMYGLDASQLKEGERVTVISWPELAGANSTDHVQDLELLNRLKSERRGYAAQFEFSNGRKFPVVESVPISVR